MEIKQTRQSVYTRSRLAQSIKRRLKRERGREKDGLRIRWWIHAGRRDDLYKDASAAGFGLLMRVEQRAAYSFFFKHIIYKFLAHPRRKRKCAKWKGGEGIGSHAGQDDDVYRLQDEVGLPWEAWDGSSQRWMGLGQGKEACAKRTSEDAKSWAPPSPPWLALFWGVGATITGDLAVGQPTNSCRLAR